MPEEKKISYEGQQIVSNLPGKESPDLSDKLVQWGIVANTQQANYLLLGVVVVAIGIALFFSWNLIAGPSSGGADDVLGDPIASSGVVIQNI